MEKWKFIQIPQARITTHTCVHVLYGALSLLIFNFHFLMHARNIKHSFYNEILFLEIYNSSCTECILQINIFSNSKMWKLKINSLNSCFFLLLIHFNIFSVFLHNEEPLCIHFWLVEFAVDEMASDFDYVECVFIVASGEAAEDERHEK